jgi:hypothetical protein
MKKRQSVENEKAPPHKAEGAVQSPGESTYNISDNVASDMVTTADVPKLRIDLLANVDC